MTENGDLRIEGHDMGSFVEEFWGAGLTEYEWIMTVPAAEISRVVGALEGAVGDDVLPLLSARFAEDAKYASKSFFEEQGIPLDFWSRVGK